MKNGRKDNYPQVIILLDKLVFTCTSLVEDNFDYLVTHEPEYLYYDFQFGNTRLTKTQDPSRRYQHSFLVLYKSQQVGTIDFKMYGALYNDLIRFTVYNEVFYNGNLKYLQNVLNDLNLKIHNFTKIDIAIDCYKFNTEQFIRTNLKKKENTIKLLGKIIKDRNKILHEITYYNHGSLNNPFKVRTTLIKNKKKTFELEFYDKIEEIKISDKNYILEFHRKINPKLRKIHRAEMRLAYDEIARFVKKHKSQIQLRDLMNPNFLLNTYNEYLDRIMTVYTNSTQKREKVQIIPTNIITSLEGILQSTLQEVGKDSIKVINEVINFLNINNNSNYEDSKKFIRRYQEENKQFFERCKESQFWQTSLAPTQKQNQSITQRLLGENPVIFRQSTPVYLAFLSC